MYGDDGERKWRTECGLSREGGGRNGRNWWRETFNQFKSLKEIKGGTGGGRGRERGREKEIKHIKREREMKGGEKMTRER